MSVKCRALCSLQLIIKILQTRRRGCNNKLQPGTNYDKLCRKSSAVSKLATGRIGMFRWLWLAIGNDHTCLAIFSKMTVWLGQNWFKFWMVSVNRVTSSYTNIWIRVAQNLKNFEIIAPDVNLSWSIYENICDFFSDFLEKKLRVAHGGVVVTGTTKLGFLIWKKSILF